MPRGIQRKGIIRRNKILRSAVKLFLEGGYEKTTTANIAQAAGMAPAAGTQPAGTPAPAPRTAMPRRMTTTPWSHYLPV